MDHMNQSIRKNFDVQVAFDANLKKQEIASLNQHEPVQKQSLLKRGLRGIARYAYRLAKPILRPIAVRIRRYLMADLQQQIRGEVEGLRASLENKLSVIESYGAASTRRIAISCGADEVMVRTEVGYLLCAASDHALLACLLDTGELERGTRILIQKYLRPGDVYVDIGANIGLHTLAAARAMQGKGKIIAFEPFAGTMRMLEKSIFLNGFSGIAELHEAAVANSNGPRLLFLGATSGHHSLYSLETQTQGAQGPFEVKVVSLESALPSNQRIDLLKIDAEGAELEVLEGGINLITTNPDIALIVEFGPSHLRRVGHTPRQWLDSFTHFGFDYKAINPDTGMLEEWSIGALEQVESINLFFARPGSTAWTRIQ
jgi:FkbM family methyltransferase